MFRKGFLRALLLSMSPVKTSWCNNQKVCEYAVRSKILGEQTIAAAKVRFGSTTCIVETIDVLPCFQHAGVGRTTMHHIEQEARNNGCAKVQLVSLQSARGFYEKCGYINLQRESKLFLKYL